MKKPIVEIIITDRRREELGDLAGLATSIEKYGLIQPIVIDSTGVLIAGERRLEACKRLGWTEVEVRSHGELTEDERLAVELEENIRRKDLTTLEYHKKMGALGKRAEPIITEKKQQAKDLATPVDLFPLDGNKSKRGAPRKDTATQAEIADALGISPQQFSAGQRYVRAVEKYPEIATTPGVPMVDGIKIAETLDTLPEEVREQKRQALQSGQRNILADLTGKPPIPEPNGDSKTAQQDIKWQKTLGNLTAVVNGLEQDGFIDQMLASWSLATKQKQLLTFRHVSATFTHVAELIQASIAEEESSHA